MNELSINIPIETAQAAAQALMKMPWDFSNPHLMLLDQRIQQAVAAAKQAQEAAAQAQGKADNAPQGEGK